MRLKILFSILMVLINAPMLFSEELNPKDTIGLGRVVAGVPEIAWWWNYLRNDPQSIPHDTLAITEKYDTIFTHDIDNNGTQDIVATVGYANVSMAAGGPHYSTVVALRKADSLAFHFSTNGHVEGILDTLIPGYLVLINRRSWCHGFCENNRSFFLIWPKIGTLLSTSTFSYRCSEEEQFRFVSIKKLEPRLIARLFERKCDPEMPDPKEKPKKKLEIFRYHEKERNYEEWNPTDEKIWKKAMKAFGLLLEREDLEKLKGQ